MSLGNRLYRASLICIVACCAWKGFTQTPQVSPAVPPLGRIYFVDCGDPAGHGDGSEPAPLHSLGEVNRIPLHANDSLLFKRGSVCKGELQPKGSGMEGAPIHIGPYGKGPLPRIEAGRSEEAAFRIFNQSFWEISSLDLSGGTTYGIYAGGDAADIKHLHLRDVRVHDVRGTLKQKESGLIVVWASGRQGNYDDVELDGVEAYDTTQWAGIFVSGASRVRVRNSTVHDVQGDGIVVFHARDAVISRSLAWHTGMQHQFTIGTPNAIWTWECTDCAVEENEAFLTDSPGVDGGAFDIDTGNTRNTVERNFGHDTVGYCVAIFAAFTPTIDSSVKDNLCIHNGMSPRLAQRQGVLLLMTWQGGVLNGVDIRNNRIYWDPAGDTPAIQAGDALNATRVTLNSNEIESTALTFVDPTLVHTGEHNRYILASDDPADRNKAMPAVLALHEESSSLTLSHNKSARQGRLRLAATAESGWRLEFSGPDAVPGGQNDEAIRGTIVQMKSAALQFGQSGLKVAIAGGASLAALAEDWSLPSAGVVLQKKIANIGREFSLRLVSPTGKVVREWHACPSPPDLGLALRQNVGPPDFSRLPLQQVRATD